MSSTKVLNKKDLKEPNKNSGILNYNREVKVSLGFSSRSEPSEDSANLETKSTKVTSPWRQNRERRKGAVKTTGLQQHNVQEDSISVSESTLISTVG